MVFYDEMQKVEEETWKAIDNSMTRKVKVKAFPRRITILVTPDVPLKWVERLFSRN